MLSTDIDGVDVNGLRAGDDWRVEIPIAGVAWLPGDSARMHMRTTLEAATPTLAFSTSPVVGQGLIELLSDALAFSAAAALTSVAPGKYVYDIEFTRGGVRETLFGGVIQVAAKVTR